MRAALDIVAAVAHIRTIAGRRTRLRIGIATGFVVMREPRGCIPVEHASLVKTPNLAARLQTLADPGLCCRLREDTRSLTRQVSLIMRDLGPTR